jgi:hypothetical protein
MAERPFTKRAGDTVMINSTRLIESIVIALVAGVLSVGGSYFVTIPTLQVQFGALQDKVNALVTDQRQSNNAAASDRADIIRLQAQMTSTQQQLVATQQQITDVAKSSNERLSLMERTVMRFGDKTSIR